MSTTEKQRISEMIQQRIREKEEQERANRPRVPVLKVMFSNAARAYRQAMQLREALTLMLEEERANCKQKKEAVNTINNMGREPHTQLTIKTDFYASEFIPSNIKEFYRKASNNFLKLSILQKRDLAAHKEKQAEIKECLAVIRKLEAGLTTTRSSASKARDQQLVQNMQQRVRYEDQLERGFKLRNDIADLNAKNQADAKEYNFKKDNLSNMEKRVADLKHAIERQLKRYEETYNIVTYRQHLKKVFDVKLKIEVLQDQHLQSRTSKLENILEKKNSFVRYGPVESFRTASKSMQRRNGSLSRFEPFTDRRSSASVHNTSGFGATGKTDRTLSTSKRTRRSLLSEIY